MSLLLHICCELCCNFAKSASLSFQLVSFSLHLTVNADVRTACCCWCDQMVCMHLSAPCDLATVSIVAASTVIKQLCLYQKLLLCADAIWWMLSNQSTVYTGLARRDPMLTRKMIFGCCHQILPVRWQQVEQESGAQCSRAGSCWPAVPGMAPTRRAGVYTL